MKKKISFVCICLFILGLSEVGAVPYFTDEIFGDQYTKHPNFQYAEDENGHGKTYITFSATDDDDPYVWAYDHQLKKSHINHPPRFLQHSSSHKYQCLSSRGKLGNYWV